MSPKLKGEKLVVMPIKGMYGFNLSNRGLILPSPVGCARDSNFHGWIHFIAIGRAWLWDPHQSKFIVSPRGRKGSGCLEENTLPHEACGMTHDEETGVERAFYDDVERCTTRFSGLRCGVSRGIALVHGHCHCIGCPSCEGDYHRDCRGACCRTPCRVPSAGQRPGCRSDRDCLRCDSAFWHRQTRDRGSGGRRNPNPGGISSVRSMVPSRLPCSDSRNVSGNRRAHPGKPISRYDRGHAQRKRT